MSCGAPRLKNYFEVANPENSLFQNEANFLQLKTKTWKDEF